MEQLLSVTQYIVLFAAPVYCFDLQVTVAFFQVLSSTLEFQDQGFPANKLKKFTKTENACIVSENIQTKYFFSLIYKKEIQKKFKKCNYILVIYHIIRDL